MLRAGAKPPTAEQRPVKVKAVFAVIVALVLAGCGSGSSSTTNTHGEASASSTSVASSAPASATSTATTGASAARPPATASSTTPATTTNTGPGAPSSSTTATGTVAPSSSTTAAAGVALCRAPGLALSFLGQQGATGHGEIAFALRNTSGASCRTIGYPGILFLDRDGAPLPTIPTHTTQDFFGSAPLRALQVAPGGGVSFRLGVTHGIASTTGCTTAHGLQVIAPGDSATLRIAIPDGAYECQHVTVSPLQPGNSAYP